MRDIKIIVAVAAVLLLCAVISLSAGAFLLLRTDQSEDGGPLTALVRRITGDRSETGDQERDQQDTIDDGEDNDSGSDPAQPEQIPTFSADPTPEIPPEICDSDPCAIAVIVPPVDDLGSGDCQRFTEADVLAPVLFEVPRTAITAVAPEGGMTISGDISLETPLGPLSMGSVELTYERYDPGLGGFESVSGRTEVPSTFMEMAGFGGPVEPLVVDVGIARGRDLEHLDAPLCPGRQYLHFTIEKEADLDLEDGLGTSFSYAIRSGGSIIIDPLDPSYQLHGKIPTLGRSSIGRSFLGLIPFTPETNWGVEEQVIPFTGHSYKEVDDLDLSKAAGVPLALSGTVIVDVDPENNSQIDFENIRLNPISDDELLETLENLVQQSSDHAVGGDGGLSIALPIPGDMNLQIAGDKLFDFDLADGSAAVYFTGGRSQAYFSGFSNQEPMFPMLPLQPASAARTSGYISDQLTDFEIRQEGQYDLRPGLLAQTLPIELTPLKVEGSTVANIQGTHFVGTALSQIHPDILFDGEVSVEARSFLANPSDSFMAMSRALSMPAFGISGDSQLTVNASGLSIVGTFALDIGRIVQNGSVSLGNMYVDGTLKPVEGGYLVSGVTSTQIHEMVSLGSQIAVEAFMAADPLASYVRISGDLQVAGVPLTDASLEIGPSDILVEGNYSTPLNTIRLSGSLTNAGPKLSGSTGVSLPLRSQAASISGWEIDNQCIPNAEINTCTIRTLIGSIDGIRHAVTGNICIPFPSGGFDDCSIRTPAVSLGELTGDVNLQLGFEGLGGSFDASFCPVTGGCQSLTSGRLLLASEPQACASVPVVGQEICIPF